MRHEVVCRAVETSYTRLGFRGVIDGNKIRGVFAGLPHFLSNFAACSLLLQITLGGVAKFSITV
jgi:hypothetical protein